MGGDGTLLHMAKVFPYEVPPVLSFSMGTLGFLMPFDMAEHREILRAVMGPGTEVEGAASRDGGDGGDGGDSEGVTRTTTATTTTTSSTDTCPPHPAPPHPTTTTTTTFTPRMRLQVEMRDERGDRVKLFGNGEEGGQGGRLGGGGGTTGDDEGTTLDFHYAAQFMNEVGMGAGVGAVAGSGQLTHSPTTPFLPSPLPPLHRPQLLLHRGTSPAMVTLSCYVDGEFFTRTTGDGVIFATPTGSTAYALASGGPLVHPLIPSIQLCPVCPQSLSFRSILLPPDSFVRIEVEKPGHGRKGKGTSVEVSGDGRIVGHVGPGGAVELRTSPFPVPTINRPAHRVTWVRDTNELLRWNVGFHTQPQTAEQTSSGSDGGSDSEESEAESDREERVRMDGMRKESVGRRRMSMGFACEAKKPPSRRMSVKGEPGREDK
ncbi:NADH kinase pos5 [Gonapodya sp. JEL0774]|nr:NADH kinase pos5 [Gonapodya sp. JEL0774]